MFKINKYNVIGYRRCHFVDLMNFVNPCYNNKYENVHRFTLSAIRGVLLERERMSKKRQSHERYLR